MSDKTILLSFEAIARSSSSNFHALRVLVSHIGGLADKYDEGTVSAFCTTLSDLFPSLAQKIQMTGEETDPDKKIEPDKKTSSELETEAPSASADSIDAESNREFEQVFNNDHGRAKFFNAIRELTKRHPTQGSLIRQGALTTLFSHFEGTLAQLMHAYYERYPTALPADDRTLTLADLRQVGSVFEAEKLIIGKEIDSVLRQNTEEQIAYFRKRLKVDVEPLGDLMSSIVEIAQRRNIYVHNDGKVNRQYLAFVDQSLATKYMAEEGKRQALPTDYLLNAIDTIDAAAAMLTQACWRKWDKSKDADDNLIDLTYEGLRDQRFEYVKMLAVYAKGAGVVEDASRRMLLINHAIALRETGDQDGVRKLLHDMDWSAASLKFSLALHVLREEKEEFLRILPKAMAAEAIKVQAMRDWPLFSPWRGQGWFDNALAGFEPTPQAIDHLNQGG